MVRLVPADPFESALAKVSRIRMLCCTFYATRVFVYVRWLLDSSPVYILADEYYLLGCRFT
jgi:hypothetical protein